MVARIAPVLQGGKVPAATAESRTSEVNRWLINQAGSHTNPQRTSPARQPRVNTARQTSGVLSLSLSRLCVDALLAGHIAHSPTRTTPALPQPHNARPPEEAGVD